MKTLVIMAAGIGSRYGGVKQAEPVGPSGELIIDYSVYDAVRAGFARVVLVITRAIEADFRAAVGQRIERGIDVAYAYQSIDDLPAGFAVPSGRAKPWGTCHAVMAARDELPDEPYAVINADDYYGPGAFEGISRWLDEPRRGVAMRHAMTAYRLDKTLPDSGSVTRGVCSVEGGRLKRVRECRGVERRDGGVRFPDGDGWAALAPETLVSMNFWALDARFIETIDRKFPTFLERGLARDPMRCEYLLPDEIDDELASGEAEVDVLQSDDRWHGVTYRADRESVVRETALLHEAGLYPTPLWG